MRGFIKTQRRVCLQKIFYTMLLIFLSFPFHFYLEKAFAQTEMDETYDPFTDYSEFDDSSEEEADIHFFKNGRFFTIGLLTGFRSFTGNLAKLYSPSTEIGIYLSYFFDMRFSLQFGLSTSEHDFSLKTGGVYPDLNGVVSLTFFTFQLKYYLNTQNITKGLADFNPYLLGGVSQVNRSYMLAGDEGYSRDVSYSPNVGAGMEIPFLRKKAFLGLQGSYHIFTFKDKNSFMYTIDAQGNSQPTQAKPSGDSFDIMAILGFNF